MTSPPTGSIPGYRADIDGLRGFAVLAVVAFHAFPNYVRGGFIGVDVFFVISGYLISGIILGALANHCFSFLNFYLRRIRRLFPSLVVMLITTYGVGWYLLLPEDFGRLGKHMAGGATFVSNMVLWQEAGYFDQLPKLKPLLHLWSLGIEEQFYLVWPWMLCLMVRFSFSPMFILLPMAFLSFAVDAHTVNANRDAAFFLPHMRFWELLLGAMLSVVKRQQRSLVWGNMLAVAGLLLVLGSALGFNTTLDFPGYWALLPTMGAFLLIATGSIGEAGGGTWLHRDVLAFPPLVWVGLVSYPLYLWHWPLLVYLHILFPGVDGAPAAYRLCVVALSVLLAWLTYRHVERPIRFGQVSAAKILWLLVVLEGAGAVGLVTYLNTGFVFRVPESIRALASTSYNINDDWRVHQCFVDPGKGESFGDGSACIEKGEGLLVFLWGDSHAAALYPGLKALQADRPFRIAQFTVSDCAPLLKFEERHQYIAHFTVRDWAPSLKLEERHQYCASYNDAIFSIIGKTHPDVVMLEARWLVQLDKQIVPRLEATVEALKNIGIPRIILVGPPPRWQYGFSTVFNTYLLHERVQEGLVFPQVQQADVVLRDVAKKAGIEYFSVYEALCNDKGCLTHAPGDNDHLLLFDTKHLTPEASRALMRQFSGRLFPGKSF